MSEASFLEFVVRKGGAVKALSGGALSSDEQSALSELLGKRPMVRKVGDGLVCTAPSGADWYVRTYADKPTDGMVADLLRDVQSVANDRDRNGGASSQTGLIPILEDATGVLRKNRNRCVLNALIDEGFMASGIIAPIKNGRVRRLSFSNINHRNAIDEVLAVLKGCLAQPETRRFDFACDDHAEASLDGGLLCERLHGRTLSVILPKDLQAGFAVIAVDPDVKRKDALSDLPSALSLLSPPRKFGGIRLPSLWRTGLVTALLIATAFLISPADIRVSNQARAIPSETTVVSVPFGAYVAETFVEPGEHVSKGQLLAKLTSPELENRKAEEQLAQRLEAISANEALAQGDYGAFQLAEKRGEIANMRESYLDESIAQLSVTAPEDGIVAEAISGSDNGRYLQPGSAVMSLQTDTAFDVLIEIDPSDAPLIKSGQAGFIYFRGLGNHPYSLEIAEAPQRIVDEATKTPRLQVRAHVTDPEQGQLLVGLTGFAKISVDRGPRIVGITRPIVEYTRLKLWTYLGWQI